MRVLVLRRVSRIGVGSPVCRVVGSCWERRVAWLRAALMQRCLELFASGLPSVLV